VAAKYVDNCSVKFCLSLQYFLVPATFRSLASTIVKAPARQSPASSKPSTASKGPDSHATSIARTSAVSGPSPKAPDSSTASSVGGAPSKAPASQSAKLLDLEDAFLVS